MARVVSSKNVYLLDEEVSRDEDNTVLIYE